ncbi:hypothetical protein N9505_07360 [Candidatus Thioglobus sp.]|nr:hypothetical protein [Candidatus Thioglobus sp.]
MGNLKRLKQIKGRENKLQLFLFSKATIILKEFLDREAPNDSIKAIIDWKYDNKFHDSYIDNKLIALSSFNMNVEINSENLLISLINNQLNEGDENLSKFWLDLLVKRFEVTKKIYKSYPVNFCKGRGRHDIVQLYWMFALSLTLYFCATKNIKYISTLLKVSDLLCSLDDKLLNEGLPSQGLSLILLVELISVKLLSKTIDEVNFEFV